MTHCALASAQGGLVFILLPVFQDLRAQQFAVVSPELIVLNLQTLATDLNNRTSLKPITLKEKITVVALYRVDGLCENK